MNEQRPPDSKSPAARVPEVEIVPSPTADPVAVSMIDELPAYYRQGFVSFQVEAQRRDHIYRQRWVHVSAKNQQMKRYKGWEPLEDRNEILRLGIEAHLINARGRAQWIDTELWRMPVGRANAIRRHLAEKTEARGRQIRNDLAAMTDEVAGRSRGHVQPFMHQPIGEDIRDRTPNPPPTPTRGGKK